MPSVPSMRTPLRVPMRGFVERSGNSPCSLSSSGSLNADLAAMAEGDVSLLLSDILFAPRENGGFGGMLRYCELAPLLQRLGCSWSTERLDDCWYDMVRGRPLSVMDDMAWAAQCIRRHMGSERLELSAILPPASPRTREVSPSTVFGPHAVSPPPPDVSPPSAVATRKPRDGASRSARGEMPRSPRFASTTASSRGRSRARVGASPPRRAVSSAQTDAVFRRLLEDVQRRKSRAASPPISSPVSNRPPPAPRVGRWCLPTRSFCARLVPEPPPPDPMETQHTPRVEGRPPNGPSPNVPTGYVAAVARMRRYAKGRSERPFAESLRAPKRESVAEETPILRLPISGGEAVVDVRLASGRAKRTWAIPGSVAFDDPSRVVIQDVLRESGRGANRMARTSSDLRARRCLSG